MRPASASKHENSISRETAVLKEEEGESITHRDAMEHPGRVSVKDVVGIEWN